MCSDVLGFKIYGLSYLIYKNFNFMLPLLYSEGMYKKDMRFVDNNDCQRLFYRLLTNRFSDIYVFQEGGRHRPSIRGRRHGSYEEPRLEVCLLLRTVTIQVK